MLVPNFTAAKPFFEKIKDATSVGSGRDWYEPDSNGTEINRTEANEALRTLDRVAKKDRPAAIRDVLQRASDGKIELTDAAVKAFVHAYLSEQPQTNARKSGWQTRSPTLGENVYAPKFVFVADDRAGGSSTACAKAIVDDRPSFLKSQRGSMTHQTRHAVFESDILAGRLFEKLGLPAPQARMVDVSSNKQLAESMGKMCLDMELVDKKAVGGTLREGFIDKIDNIDLDAFLKMLVVDLITGNADRRGANYFTVEQDGKRVPVPVDNNCAFLSGLTNTSVTSHTNFKKSFGEDKEIKFDAFDPTSIGSIGLIVADSPDYRELLNDPRARERLPAIIDEVVATLDDKFFGGLVDALPREIVPRGTSVEPWREREGVDLSKITPEWQRAFDEAFAYAGDGVKGRDLFDARKTELKDVFAWRRDNVKQALSEYLTAHPHKPETDG